MIDSSSIGCGMIRVANYVTHTSTVGVPLKRDPNVASLETNLNHDVPSERENEHFSRSFAGRVLQSADRTDGHKMRIEAKNPGARRAHVAAGAARSSLSRGTYIASIDAVHAIAAQICDRPAHLHHAGNFRPSRTSNSNKATSQADDCCSTIIIRLLAAGEEHSRRLPAGLASTCGA